MSTSIYPLVDRILDGRLADELAERRQAGDSYQAIARWLHSEHDIAVSIETIRKWVNDSAAERGAA